jgi:hypothetical protein
MYSLDHPTPDGTVLTAGEVANLTSAERDFLRIPERGDIIGLRALTRDCCGT